MNPFCTQRLFPLFTSFAGTLPTSNINIIFGLFRTIFSSTGLFSPSAEFFPRPQCLMKHIFCPSSRGRASSTLCCLITFFMSRIFCVVRPKLRCLVDVIFQDGQYSTLTRSRTFQTFSRECCLVIIDFMLGGPRQCYNIFFSVVS